MSATRWRATSRATTTRRGDSASSTGRSRRTTRWASTTPGDGRTRTSSSATTPCSARSSATRTGSTARACGSRSTSSATSASTTSARSRSTGSAASSSDARRWVDTYAAIQTEQSKRLGYWMDWDNSYYTNSDENNYTVWAFLAECHRRGLIYRGHDVMPWCPALRDGHLQHGGGRGVLRGQAPLGDAPPADHEPRPRGRGPAGLDHHAVDPVEQRRRRGASGADLPAGRGRGRSPLVGERRLEAARRGRRRGRARGARLRAARPHLRRAVRRAAGGSRRRRTA